jgi:hypothetical protein
MTIPAPYISRLQAEAFLTALAEAVKAPEPHPVLFQVWGVGGVGKSTLLNQVQKQHSQAKVARIYFGSTSDIDTPIELMAKLYQDLAIDSWGDPFTPLYQQFSRTKKQLETEPMEGKRSVDSEQQSLLKRLLSFGIAAGSRLTPVPDIADTDSEKAAGAIIDGANLLLQHRATKRDPKLRELMENPLPPLTQAFIAGLKDAANHTPVLLILDTYEKAPNDHDNWLRQYLLDDRSLLSAQVRIVVAGRRSLEEKEAWRKLQQDRSLLFERQLREFNRDETADYLGQIKITSPETVAQIYRVTKGLPYYLNWIRREREAGREIDFSRGNEAIVSLLLQGLSAQQKQIVQLAACCRWFDRPVIQHLLTTQNIAFPTAADPNLNCFDWLKQCDFVEFQQGCYCLDDVARDIFRQSLWDEDRGATFRQVCNV